ncbi:MAG: hypothetical protein LBV69_09205 [Bacteroidales bacterium]|jgi:hypothetical protein|nr:hypothetical protein [Bacteroidales bacterium]
MELNQFKKSKINNAQLNDIVGGRKQTTGQSATYDCKGKAHSYYKDEWKLDRDGKIISTTYYYLENY